MENHVGDTETVARFLFSSSDFSTANQRVKYSAFMPAPDRAVSVYRIDGCDESEIAQIDQTYVSGLRGKPSKARAEILVEKVRKSQLDVISAPHPHHRHANIEGYPLEETEYRSKAIELAQHAKLVLKK